MSKKVDAVKIEILERLVQENEARSSEAEEAAKAAAQQEQNAAALKEWRSDWLRRASRKSLRCVPS